MDQDKNYFTCYIGGFTGSSVILRRCMDENVYLLHNDAKYPSALKLIKSGDVVLLKYCGGLVAWGIAKRCVECWKNEDGWNHALDVDAWRFYDKEHPERGISSYGIRWATLAGASMATVRQVDPDWAKGRMHQLLPLEQTKLSEDVICQELTLDRLFDLNLKIPAYQRGYCWRRENILMLFNDILGFIRQHGSDEKWLHLGSIVLKGDRECGHDVIDGQQRLLTLAILCWCLDRRNPPSILKSTLGGTANEHRSSKNNLLRAKQTIIEAIKTANIKPDIVKGNLVFTCVTLPAQESEDLAYTFFRASNSTGKALSDYDLLKTHHLRYVSDSSAHFFASCWDRLSMKESPSSDEGIQQELLHLILYRLRHWVRGNEFNIHADDTRSRVLFKHYSVANEPLDGVMEIPKQVKIDSILSGGMEFFHYVEAYRAKLEQFCKLPCQNHLNGLRWHSAGVLYSAIKAELFMFYCKFGEQYLNEALYCIAYRVSILRNKNQIRQTMLATEYIFTKVACYLDRVTLSAEFFAWALNPVERYQPAFDRAVQCRYWESLREMLEKLEASSSFAIKKNIQGITENFKQKD